MTDRFPLFTPDPSDPVRISDLVGLFTLGAGATLALSIAYQVGYLAHFGLWLSDVPATLSDYTIHALNWLPWVALAYFVFSLIILVQINLGKGRRSIPPSPTPLRTMVLSSALLIFAAIVVWIFFSDAGVIYSCSILGITWQRFSVWVVKHPSVGHEFNALERRAIYYAPALALMMFGLGWHAGDTHRTHDQTAEILLDGQQTQVEVLRSYERGVLAMHDRAVMFIEWDQVNSLSTPARRAIRGAIEYLPWMPDPPSPYQPDPNP